MLDGIWSGFIALLLWLDGIIYDLIRFAYEIFVFFAELNIFDDIAYKDIVNRIYVILGVVMLFILAYSLLKAIINPDDFSKGDNSIPNILKNVITSLVLLVIMPSIFSYAFSIQSAILNTDIIAKIILTDTSVNNNDIKTYGGNSIAFNAYRAFFYPDPMLCEDGGIECAEAKNIKSNNDNNIDLNTVTEEVKKGASFTNFQYFSDAVVDKEIEYNIFINTIVGIVLLFLVLSYCLELAIRFVKLIFYQIISPIPIISRILPDSKKKGIFENWVKQTIATFIEVFIRIAIMYLGVYLITIIVGLFGDTTSALFESVSDLKIRQRLLVLVFLIVGVMLFVKQAPKLIKDIFGIELGGSGLIPISTMLGIGAGVGAGVTTAVRNTYKDLMVNNKGGIRSTISGATGLVSGTARGMWAGKGAKNFKDMKNAANAGANAAVEAKSKRANYKASHGNSLGGVFVGHISDSIAGVKEWAGIDSGIAALKEEQDVYKEGMKFKKDFFDLVADNETVMAYQGLKKTAQEKDISLYTTYLKLDKNGYVYDKRNGTLVTDKDGNSFKNVESAAISLKVQEIERYKVAGDLAAMKAIHEKLEMGDGRFVGLMEKFNRYQKEHSSIDWIKNMELRDLNDQELALINDALNTNDYSKMNQLKKQFESDKGMLLANDKQFKIANGDIEVKISKKMEEKKKESK